MQLSLKGCRGLMLEMEGQEDGSIDVGMERYIDRLI